MTRIAATVSNPSFATSNGRKIPFLVLGGYTDFVLSSTYVNSHGCITGLANVAPVSNTSAVDLMSSSSLTSSQYSVAKLYEISVATLKDPSLLPEAQRIQGIVANADYTVAKSGVSGTKALLQQLKGYGGLPRKPLPPFKPNETKSLWEHSHIAEIVLLERQLGG